MSAGSYSYSEGLGKRIHQLRVELHRAQGKFAKEMGWRADSWSRLERGTSETINLDVLGRLCHAATEGGISHKWLLTGEGPMHGSGASRVDNLLNVIGRLIDEWRSA